MVPADADVFPGGGPNGLTIISFAHEFDTNDVPCTGWGGIDDGRINGGPDQEGAPLAAYCTNGGLAVWDIDASGHGTLGFTATAAEISKALSDAASSGQNMLVGQGLGNSLYALSTNQLTLVGPDVKEAGKTYTYIFASDRCS